jgi:hypothetical protein
MDYSHQFLAATALLFPILIFAIWLKRKAQMRKLSRSLDVVDPVVGDLKELEAAEAHLSISAMDLRRRILETHALYDRFSTLHGFSDMYMSDLTRELRDRGIDCEIYFQETVPVGVGDVLVRQGLQELYIRRDQIDDADLFLRERLQRR